MSTAPAGVQCGLPLSVSVAMRELLTLSVRPEGHSASPLVSHWALASLLRVSALGFPLGKNRLRCSVLPPFASLPRRSPRKGGGR